MTRQKPGYFGDVDELIHATRPWEAATHYGFDWPADKFSGNVRLPCVFNEACNESSYGSLTVNVDRQHSPIYCHSCHTKGKLIELMWGMKHHQPFTGEKLRGDEFKEILADLKSIRSVEAGPPAARSESPAPKPVRTSAASVDVEPNVPLKDSENERARELVALHANAIVDAATMSPPATRYFGVRPYLDPSMCEKWSVGYLPSDAKGTLRGRVIYGIDDENGDVLAWSGRDPDYATKHAQWLKSGRSKQEPIKHRFPTQKMFRKGLELYGQSSSRLDESGYRDAIKEIGILIVEGMNDVIRLDALQQPAVAVMSNRITDHQIAKVTRWARRMAEGKVTVMFDNDEQGEQGAKETLWKLHQEQGIQPRLAWSSRMFDGAFSERQPESITGHEWEAIRKRLAG